MPDALQSVGHFVVQGPLIERAFFSLRLLFSENTRFGELKSLLLIFKTIAGLKIKSFRWKAIRP